MRRLLAKPPNTRGCMGLFTDATGDKRFDDAWWKRFVDEFAPQVRDYAIVEILSAAGCTHLDPRYPSFYSGNASASRLRYWPTCRSSSARILV